MQAPKTRRGAGFCLKQGQSLLKLLKLLKSCLSCLRGKITFHEVVKISCIVKILRKLLCV